jgi:hypothetical protein
MSGKRQKAPYLVLFTSQLEHTNRQLSSIASHQSMPTAMWDDNDFQRHGTRRHQKEWRYQDRFGQTYTLKEVADVNGEQLYRLLGRGPADGEWIGKGRLDPEFLKLSS